MFAKLFARLDFQAGDMIIDTAQECNSCYSQLLTDNCLVEIWIQESYTNTDKVVIEAIFVDGNGIPAHGRILSMSKNESVIIWAHKFYIHDSINVIRDGQVWLCGRKIAEDYKRQRETGNFEIKLVVDTTFLV